MKYLFLFLLITSIGCNQNNPESEEVPVNNFQVYSIPQFSDSASFKNMEVAFPILDEFYKDYAGKNNFPAITFGVVAGGKLIHSGSVGMANIESKIPANTKSLFRIASMSKSLTAMAILKLRDEGKLSLTEPASQYLPEIKSMGALTQDAPAITIQHLLTMSAGLPEDNPWGDRQLDMGEEEFVEQIVSGTSFANVPGTNYEYSNYGYALLGKIISEVSGVTYQQYITDNILQPIGMNDTKWEFDEVPSDQLALGYEWVDGEWISIPLLHDGAYGSMGGLISSIEDFSKYMAFHLAAWPPRNDPETGPIKRSSVREMHQPWRFNAMFTDAKTRSGESCPEVVGYGYGLRWQKNCKGIIRISHSGGLPGFGSEWRIYPEFGIGVVAFSNHTYGAPAAANSFAMDTMVAIATLRPRTLSPSKLLDERMAALVKLLPSWEEDADHEVFAENFYADIPLERRKAAAAKVFQEAGQITGVQDLIPQNQLRGSFLMTGKLKDVRVFFTLTPEKVALIQQLDIELVDK